MSSRVVIVLGAGAVAVGGVMLFFVTRPAAPRPNAALPPPLAAPASPGTSPAPVIEPPPSSSSRPPAAVTRPAAAATTPDARAPTTGTLRIESDVADTSVFIDRVYLGTAPVTAEGLTPGQHHLNMSATGYDAVSQQIEVEPGVHDVSITFKEIRLDAKIAVVHKHAMGSCSGTLSATPQGLTYTPAAGNDGFTVPLTDLEAFEVDYLAKNLRVKARKGKTYNFTDPDGNADRLFVFQRDVDKVRQRIARRP